MKLFPGLSLLFFLCWLSVFAHAQANTDYSFVVGEGSVVVTPAWCAQDTCPSTTAVMSGAFEATIDGKSLIFTSSNISTTPDVYFSLPRYPNEDSNGVSREFSFTFDGSVIRAKGVIDSRAFDGPLVEYSLVADLGNAGFYTARPDYRRCAAPLCGGYFVKSVNKKLTQCADGRLQLECYVAEINLGDNPVDATHSFANATPLLLLGTQGKKTFDHYGELGVFNAKEAYRSATQVTATEKFYGLENNGILCITTPCFSYDASLLNSEKKLQLSEINLAMSGASAEDIALGYAVLANGKPLYAAGKNQSYRGFSGKGLRFDAQQFYLPIKLK